MFKRTVTLLALIGLTLAGGLSRARDDKTKDPVSKHGLTLKLRKAAEGVFYISQTGSVSAVNADLFKAG